MSAMSVISSISLKTKLITGGWAAVGGLAGAITYRRARDFERDTPCIPEAVRRATNSPAVRSALGPGTIFLGWWSRNGQVNAATGHAAASFEIVGTNGKVRVLMGAARRREEAPGMVDNDDDDELPTGWRYYWMRPWELKFLAFDAARGVRNTLFSGFRKVAEDAEAAPVAAEPGWELTDLCVLLGGDPSKQQTLVGDPRAIPAFESLCVRRDAAAKDERSRKRLKIVLGVATLVAGLAGALRVSRLLSAYAKTNAQLAQQHKLSGAARGQRGGAGARAA